MTLRVLWLQWRDVEHPWAGGAEVYMHEIARRMAEEGCEVLALTSGFRGRPEEEAISGYRVKRIGRHANYPFNLHRALGRHVEWADIIVEDTSKVPLYTPIRSEGKPVIAVVHHLSREIYFGELPFQKALLAYIMEEMMPRLYSRSPNTTFVAVSESTRQELVKLGVRPRRIVIVGNAVDEEKYKPRTNDLLAQNSPTPTVLYLSRFKRYKQPDHAVQAFKLVAEKVPHARLVVAGHGESKAKLEALIRDLGLEGKTEIRDKVGESEKVALLQESWVLLQTSKKEGFGITVLEANACGTPAVAYRVPGLRESIVDGKTGLLVPCVDVVKLSEGLLRVLTDDQLRGRMSRGAVEWAKKFNWERTAADFLQVVERSLGKAG